MNHGPYRTSELQNLCDVCQAPAQVACPVCGKPHCLDHASTLRCCADCELALSQSAHRYTRNALLAYLPASAFAATAAGVFSVYLGSVLAAGLALGGVIPVALARYLARRRLRGSWVPLDDVELTIAPASEQDREGHGLRRIKVRPRERDMYTAARNAGYGLVTPV